MGKHLYEKRLKLVLLNFILLCTIFINSLVIAASETQEETLAWIETLTAEVSESAFKAIVTCDYYSVQHAVNVADDAAYLAGELSKQAHKAADVELAWDLYNTCNHIEAAIVNLMKAAKSIADKSRDPEISQASEDLLDICIAVQKKNRTSMDIALFTFAGVVEKAEAYAK